MRGSYELAVKLWAQLGLMVGRVNAEVAWTRDEVVLSSLKFPE